MSKVFVLVFSIEGAYSLEDLTTEELAGLSQTLELVQAELEEIGCETTISFRVEEATE